MKNALLIVSGVAIGLLGALVATVSAKSYLPQAEAQAGPAGGAGAEGSTIVATGGASPNQNDVCWVLFKDKDKHGKDRFALSLYRIINNGQGFDLTDMREITYDGKLVQLNIPGHNKELSPLNLKKKLEAQEPPPQPGNPR